jgi:hypothetical protein
MNTDSALLGLIAELYASNALKDAKIRDLEAQLAAEDGAPV